MYSLMTKNEQTSPQKKNLEEEDVISPKKRTQSGDNGLRSSGGTKDEYNNGSNLSNKSSSPKKLPP